MMEEKKAKRASAKSLVPVVMLDATRFTSSEKKALTTSSDEEEEVLRTPLVSIPIGNNNSLVYAVNYGNSYSMNPFSTRLASQQVKDQSKYIFY